MKEDNGVNGTKSNGEDASLCSRMDSVVIQQLLAILQDSSYTVQIMQRASKRKWSVDINQKAI